MEDYEQIQEYRERFYFSKINKRYLKTKVKGGFRYFTKRYLELIIAIGTAHYRGPISGLNIHWLYINEFIPKMKADGWVLEKISIFPKNSDENFSNDVEITA